MEKYKMGKVEKWKSIKVPEKLWRIIRKIAAAEDKSIYKVLEDTFIS